MGRSAMNSEENRVEATADSVSTTEAVPFTRTYSVVSEAGRRVMSRAVSTPETR
jgi:hypothetical protein